MPKFLDVTSKTAAKAAINADFFVNVRDYGATGGGVSDESAAFTAAIAAASTAGGGVVYVPPGTYLIGATVGWASRVTLRGAGMGASIISPHSSLVDTSHVLQDPSGGVTDVSVEDLTFDLLSRNVGAFRFVRSETTDVKIVRCEVKNISPTTSHGMSILNMSNVDVQGCRFVGSISTPTNVGVYVISATHVSVTDCYFYGHGSSLRFNTSSYVTVQGNRFEKFGQWCTRINDSTHVSVIGNTYQDPWRPGTLEAIDGAAAAATLGTCQYVTMSDNVSYGGEISCYGRDSKDVVIANNTIYDPTVAGIEIAGSSVTALGNRIYGAGGSGIFIGNVNNSAIGNTISHCGFNGIKVAGESNPGGRAVVMGNICLNNGQNGTGDQDGIGIGNVADSAATTYVTVANNICTDTQAVKTQRYGLNIRSAIAANIQAWGNRFEGNATGAVNDASNSLVYGVDTTSAQTLSNKRFAQLLTTGGQTALALQSVTNAVNHIEITPNAAGNLPKIKAAGSDTDVSLMICPKNAGSVTIRDGNEATVMAFSGVSSPVNRLSVQNSATGSAIPIFALGSDNNISINFQPKGTGTVQINNAVIATRLTNTATLNFGSVSAQSQADLTITVTGAATGDVVALGVPTEAVTAGIAYTAWVSATNTVTVRAHNYTAGAVDPASGTFRATIIR